MKKLSINQAVAWLGGLRPLARSINVSYGAVQYWQQRNHIPEKYHAKILKAVAKQRR